MTRADLIGAVYKGREVNGFKHAPKCWEFKASSAIKIHNYNKKAVLSQGNRAMPQLFFSVKVRRHHSLQV